MKSIFRSLSLFTLFFLVVACNSALGFGTPAEVEESAYAILDDALANALGSSPDGSGDYQHRNLSISRLEEKQLGQDAIDDEITGLWCAGVSYEIAATQGAEAGIWHDAELIVLVFEQQGSEYGGGEWVAQGEETHYTSISESNQLAFENCLGR